MFLVWCLLVGVGFGWVWFGDGLVGLVWIFVVCICVFWVGGLVGFVWGYLLNRVGGWNWFFFVLWWVVLVWVLICGFCLFGDLVWSGFVGWFSVF